MDLDEETSKPNPYQAQLDRFVALEQAGWERAPWVTVFVSPNGGPLYKAVLPDGRVITGMPGLE